MNRYFLFFLAAFAFSCEPQPDQKANSLASQAADIEIIRDNWGIPHVYGKTDADAVFGMIYAQCEDDFKRVEENYIWAMGRMAEVNGEEYVYQDLRARLFLTIEEAQGIYESSPSWMKNLLNGFADGANYYLETHPEVIPRLITKFEPWMPLMFSEGSIGGDIERVSIRQLEAFYGPDQSIAFLPEVGHDEPELEPQGSNGFAIAPKLTESGSAMLLINPHTSFFFRSETHMVSEEGLNAYGAVTWGQFFIYQGFNEHSGWMHTSSRADVIDEFAETVTEKEGKFYYKYGDEEREVSSTTWDIPFKKEDGSMGSKTITGHKTHHGPIVRSEGGKWISVGMMVEPLDALTQSYMRTKANTFEEFNKNMELRTNSSNNTVYADDQGNIGYYHGNFMPKRDPQFDYSGVIDGSNPDTDWQGLHEWDELVHSFNPENGWLQNCNATPFTVAGEYSPNPDDYPIYMAPDQQNARGIHAVRVLDGQTGFTLDKLIATAYDPYLTGFENLIPALVTSYDKVGSDATNAAAAIEVLRSWDFRYSEESVATSVSIYFAQELIKAVYSSSDERLRQLELINYMTSETSDKMKLTALTKALAILEADFGSWETEWGEINRFQRVNGDIVEPFNDELESNPIAFTSSMWGALSAYGSRTRPGTKKWYGTSGNSFVAVVEFGDKLKAKAIVTGGQSGDPASPHFNDQAEMYRRGEFREVLFYRGDIEPKAQKIYNPGS